MHALDPGSEEELARIDAPQLTRAVRRVQADPGGRGQPGHPYTRKFQNPRAYVDVRRGEKVWEFSTNHYRALFVTFATEGKRGIFFIPVRGRRFWTMGECPWH